VDAIFEMDLTHKQMHILFRIYEHYRGKPYNGRNPLYFEFVSELEIMETWHPLVKSKLIMLFGWCNLYSPLGRILYVRLAPRGDKIIKRFCREIRRMPLEQLPELLTSEVTFVQEEASKRFRKCKKVPRRK